MGEQGAFLINPYGMMYEEITASSLIKVDQDGNILSKPDFGALDRLLHALDATTVAVVLLPLARGHAPAGLSARPT